MGLFLFGLPSGSRQLHSLNPTSLDWSRSQLSFETWGHLKIFGRKCCRICRLVWRWSRRRAGWLSGFDNGVGKSAGQLRAISIGINKRQATVA